MYDNPFLLLGYAIMDNHYHLMIQTYGTPLQKIMQKLNNKYSKSYNKRHNRSGHVFGERYKAILVKDDKYILSLLRYIHQNPVHAGICRSVKDYIWSSDQYYRNKVRKIVDIDKILNMFSSNPNKALSEYIKFMDKQEPLVLDKKLYEDTSIIGEEDNHLNKEKDIQTLDEILSEVGVSQVDFKLIKEGSRKRYLTKYKMMYARLATQEGYTFKEIGSNINLSATAANQMAINIIENEDDAKWLLL